MSTLTKVLERNIKVIEKNADLTEGRFRLGHHLMPPVGWLNDPNGLCWYKGRYHVFFQYAPFDVEGGLKFWGHYTSEDLVDWKYEGTALYPDSPYDCHGVYSGSALAESEKLHLFFTGNVKIDGDYDYINEGRETSTLHVESEDGIHFGDKEEIISFEKYPEEFTCHIRDPKVWKENDRYFMVLGGRLKGVLSPMYTGTSRRFICFRIFFAFPNPISTGEFPHTMLIPITSISGDFSASIIARLSSIPGSQSIITFLFFI